MLLKRYNLKNNKLIMLNFRKNQAQQL